MVMKTRALEALVILKGDKSNMNFIRELSDLNNQLALNSLRKKL